MKSKNVEVQKFLDEIELLNNEKFHTLIALRKMVYKVFPKTTEKFMYGGIIFSLNSENYSGLFVRKNHLSFEFSTGFKMKDPNIFLEGGGKFRRHLKIKSPEDIKNKEVASFVKQAI